MIEEQDRPITVADIVPFLSERGTVEVDSAIKSLRLALADQEIARLSELLKEPDIRSLSE